MDQDDENIFKRIPDINEINRMISNLISGWESKLNMDYIDKKLSKKDTDIDDIVYLNTVIREILGELSASTTSQLLSGVNRYIKRTYWKDVSDNITSIHILFDEINSKCFKDNTKAPLGILLIGIFLSKCIQYKKDNLIHPEAKKLSLEYISWYYGDYNTILDEITSLEDTSIFWMDDRISWEGYNKEELVVIPIQYKSEDPSKQSILLRCYIKSISSFIRANDVYGYIIISTDKPPDFYIENKLIHPKNIRLFVKKETMIVNE
tara:strand:+ start:21878 stop:22669 length:792 start_codon:yes stop_codon:yes gene_type:complete